jgi:AraC-like DNA-binding protein
MDPRRSGDKIGALAYECGFGDISYFNRALHRHFGSAPSDIRARARLRDFSQRDRALGVHRSKNEWPET